MTDTCDACAYVERGGGLAGLWGGHKRGGEERTSERIEDRREGEGRKLAWNATCEIIHEVGSCCCTVVVFEMIGDLDVEGGGAKERI